MVSNLSGASLAEFGGVFLASLAVAVRGAVTGRALLVASGCRSTEPLKGGGGGGRAARGCFPPVAADTGARMNIQVLRAGPVVSVAGRPPGRSQQMTARRHDTRWKLLLRNADEIREMK